MIINEIDFNVNAFKICGSGFMLPLSFKLLTDLLYFSFFQIKVSLYFFLAAQFCCVENEDITQVNYCIRYCYESKTKLCWERWLFSTVGQYILPT